MPSSNERSGEERNEQKTKSRKIRKSVLNANNTHAYRSSIIQVGTEKECLCVFFLNAVLCVQSI